MLEGSKQDQTTLRGDMGLSSRYLLLECLVSDIPSQGIEGIHCSWVPCREASLPDRQGSSLSELVPGLWHWDLPRPLQWGTGIHPWLSPLPSCLQVWVSWLVHWELTQELSPVRDDDRFQSLTFVFLTHCLIPVIRKQRVPFQHCLCYCFSSAAFYFC